MHKLHCSVWPAKACTLPKQTQWIPYSPARPLQSTWNLQWQGLKNVPLQRSQCGSTRLWKGAAGKMRDSCRIHTHFVKGSRSDLHPTLESHAGSIELMAATIKNWLRTEPSQKTPTKRSGEWAEWIKGLIKSATSVTTATRENPAKRITFQPLSFIFCMICFSSCW